MQLSTSTTLPTASASGWFMSVISADGLHARAVCHLHQRMRQTLGLLRLGHEGAVAES